MQCSKEFALRNYDWKVVVWYLDGEKNPDYEAIAEDLSAIGFSGVKLERAMSLLSTEEENIGLTYSNFARHLSVMVIGHTSSADECANTLVHERKHIEYHICKSYGIDPYSEEAAYLAGRIASKMYKQAQVLLCKECRQHYLSATEE